MRRWSDAAVSAGLLVLGEFEVWVGGAAGGSWPGAITVAAACLALLGRHRSPIGCAFAIVAAQAVCARWAEPDAFTFAAATMVAWYCVGRWANPRYALVSLVIVCVGAVAMVSTTTPRADWLNQYLAVTLAGFAVPWLVGFVVRSRADIVDRRGSQAVIDAPTVIGTSGAGTPSQPDTSRLSPREREVFTLLANGQSNTEIAQELFLSVYTVKAHVASILAKLGLRDRVQVVVYAHDPDAVSRATTTDRA